jgi:hypothetical protein
VTRQGDFNGAFTLKPAGQAALEKAPDIAVAEKATNANWELNLAEQKLPEGTHTLWLQGQLAGKYRNQPEALAAAEAELKTADAELAAAKPEGKTVAEQKRKVIEERRKAAEERAKPRDVLIGVWSRPITIRVLPAPKPEAAK